MNLKKKLRNFFTMSRKANGGFTLVELIVVIAILAILAGVAVPAYSGYVEKANEATDQALLAEVNTAFAAACAMNGEDHYGRQDVGTQTITDGVLNYTGPYDTDFEFFYEGGVFKKITALCYNNIMGMFEPGISFNANGVTYTASDADVAKLLGSTWAEKLTSQQILDLVTGTVDTVEEIYSGYFDAMVGDQKFKDAAAKALGVESYGDYLDAQVEAQAKADFEANYPGQSWDDLGDTTKGRLMESVRGDVESNLNSNVAILVAAQGAQAQKDTVMNILTTNPSGAKDFFEGNLTNLDGDTTTGLSQAAVAYGLYSSYVLYQNPDKSLAELEAEGLLAPTKAWDAFDDDAFQTYLNGQGQQDLDGLMASMNVISGQNQDAVSSAVINGVNNADLVGVLEQILGK